MFSGTFGSCFLLDSWKPRETLLVALLSICLQDGTVPSFALVLVVDSSWCLPSHRSSSLLLLSCEDWGDHAERGLQCCSDLLASGMQEWCAILDQ